MQNVFNRKINHTDSFNPMIKQSSFSGINIKDQPKKSIYNRDTPPIPWWLQGDPIKFLMGVTAYINLGSKIGFGINETALNTGVVPKIIDRSSPFMWV